MIQRNQKLINRLNVLSDGVICLVCYVLSSWFWLDVMDNDRKNMAAVHGLGDQQVLIAAAIYAVWTLVLLAVLSVYGNKRTFRVRGEYARIVTASAIALATAAAMLYLFRLEEFSRGVLGVYFISSTALLIGKRVIVRFLLQRLRARGYNLKHMVVVGGGRLAERFIKSAAAHPDLGIRVNYRWKPKERSLSKLEKRLKGVGVDEVILALEPDELAYTTEIIHLCEKCGTKVSVIPFYNDVIPTRPRIETVGDMKLIELRTTPLDEPVAAFMKRAFDTLVSALLLVMLFPLLLGLALAVKISSPGPAIFAQERIGRNKKPFKMYKFRSMRVNSDQDTAWSKKEDDRRTGVGAVMRKFSLDELPQLFNVLKGEMSLVGPRPELPYFVEQFRETVPLYMVKYQVRPGMTGWAQINGLRGDTSIPARVEHDLWYIENWTFGLDLKILARTAFGGMVNRETIRKKDGGEPDARG